MPPQTRYAKSGDVNVAYQVRVEDRGDRELKGIGTRRLFAVL